MVKGLRNQNKRKSGIKKEEHEGRHKNNFGGIGKANFEAKALWKNHWHGNGKQILILSDQDGCN